MSSPEHTIDIQRYDVPYTFYELQNVLPMSVFSKCVEIGLTLNESCSISGSRGDGDSRCHLKASDAKHRQIGEFLNTAFRSKLKDLDLLRDTNNRSALRAELCRDGSEFWQVPHLDVTDKLVTVVIYLLSDVDGLGTTIYENESPESKFAVSRALPNCALAFRPSNVTWHGFHKRTELFTSRLSLIVNFVSTWNDVHELY